MVVMRIPKEKIPEIIEQFKKLPPEARLCLLCHAPLTEVKDAWDDAPRDAWLYSPCLKCGSENALWKLFRRAGYHIDVD